jgi:tetratricopeptide (TPR) repeat protein
VTKSGGHIVEASSDGTETILPIVHVLGGKNVYYFLTPWKRGRLQTLPLAYDVHKDDWFDTAASGVRHFPGREEDEPLHWTAREYTFNTSCYSCHVSQLSTNYSLESDTYHTTWAEPGINCETCHGEGAEHVRVCREAPEGTVPEDLKIIQTGHFNVEQSNTMCAPCHAKMMPLTTDFKPGDRYFDHFDLVTLEHPDFYPDGRDLGENYTYTSWRMSPCVRGGDFDCMHCHTSSGRFRFEDDPNQSCMPCHSARVRNVAAHSHHPADSEASECNACHMPKTRFARMVRSDHSMRPPTPATTMEFDSPNACNLCHTDRDAAWSDEWVRKWHRRDYQKPVLDRSRLIDEARRGKWERLPEMAAYIADPDRDEIVANSLVRLLLGCRDDQKWAILIDALDDPSPLIRASAAVGLEGYRSQAAVGALLGTLDDDYRLPRVRAAATLAGIPETRLEPPHKQNLERATDELVSGLQARPDNPYAHYNLGNLHSSQGETQEAIDAYQQAIELDPGNVEARVNLSMVYHRQGRVDDAERVLQEALELAPESPVVNLNLGLLLGELGRLEAAERSLRRVFEADPTSATAAYNIGIILVQRGADGSLEWLRRAYRLEPETDKYGYTLAFYLYQGGQQDKAVKILESLIRAGTELAEVYALLGQIRESNGHFDKARTVYERAASSDDLPPQARRYFSARARSLQQQRGDN